MPLTTRKRWWAMVRQRCPRCLEGRVFSGSVAMNKTCPVCQFTFEREPGYFLGAMYVSYALAIPVLGLFTYVGHLLWPDLDLGLIVMGATVVYLPFVPVVFRYSRVLWMYFDHWAWPEPEASEKK
jgi:uncharacterized protein (DUF983 family)